MKAFDALNVDEILKKNKDAQLEMAIHQADLSRNRPLLDSLKEDTSNRLSLDCQLPSIDEELNLINNSGGNLDESSTTTTTTAATKNQKKKQVASPKGDESKLERRASRKLKSMSPVSGSKSDQQPAKQLETPSQEMERKVFLFFYLFF